MIWSASGQTQSSTSNANKESGQASASASGQSTVASYPIVNEEITIKVLALKHASLVDFDNLADSPAWKYISELTGIKFEFEEYLKENLAIKKLLIMADPSSRPDIFWRVNEADKNIGSYADQGMSLSLKLRLKYGNIAGHWEKISACCSMQ